MKYKIIFLCFLTSCVNNTYISKNNFTFSSKGFAKIDNQSVSKLNHNFFVSHNKLRTGAKIRITNPENKKNLELTIKKKIKYDDFYKVFISKSVVLPLFKQFIQTPSLKASILL